MNFKNLLLAICCVCLSILIVGLCVLGFHAIEHHLGEKWAFFIVGIVFCAAVVIEYKEITKEQR